MISIGESSFIQFTKLNVQISCSIHQSNHRTCHLIIDCCMVLSEHCQLQVRLYMLTHTHRHRASKRHPSLPVYGCNEITISGCLSSMSHVTTYNYRIYKSSRSSDRYKVNNIRYFTKTNQLL